MLGRAGKDVVPASDVLLQDVVLDRPGERLGPDALLLRDELVEQEQERGRIVAHRAARAANLFDLRRIIGGLFVVYGVILTVLGLAESDAEIAKSAGRQHQPL